MRNVQFVVGAVVAVLAFAAVPQAHADVYDYGYDPVYGAAPISSGACPNGQCSGGYYSPIYSASYPAYSVQNCPSGACGSFPNGSCGLRGQCTGGQCTSGQCSTGRCSSGQCSTGQCANGSCRTGRCGTCPSGDCERKNCGADCPNGQCTTRYRGSIDPQSRPALRIYDRPDYGPREETLYRANYSSERPSYRGRDYRDESVSRRSRRSDPRELNRDTDRESPFYN
jgi:hypothetical protein